MDMILERLRKIIVNPTFLIAVLAGLLYSSWPLGYIVNPIVTRHDFASQLEASHEPYNWLFVALDILTGVVLLVMGYYQIKKSPKRIGLKLSIVGYMLFGILVIAAAVAPFNCNSISQNCVAMAMRPDYIIHGMSSIFSVVFLFISLLILCKMLAERRINHWLTVVSFFTLVSWGMIGLYALIQIEMGVKSNWLQYIFITVCSVSIALSIGLIEYLSKKINEVVDVVEDVIGIEQPADY